MKRGLIILTATLAAFFSQSLIAQEEAMEEAEASQEYQIPAPLNENAWYSWMVGEWEGQTETGMAKMNDWMKCELALDNQFVIAHYKSQTVSINEEEAQKQGMSAEQIEAMKTKPYKGMGVFTVNPQSGESLNYWFGNWRDVSTGKGTREGNKEVVHWESPMGKAVRTLEKVSDDELLMTFEETMADGSVFKGKTVMKRKSAMSGK